MISPSLPDVPEFQSGQTCLDEAILNRRYRVALPAFFQVNTRRERRELPLGLERWAHLAPKPPLPPGESSAPLPPGTADVPSVPGSGEYIWPGGAPAGTDGTSAVPGVDATEPSPTGRGSSQPFYSLSIADILALLVFDGLDPSPEDVVLDAYCGVGTFSILLAPLVKQVIGIEESVAAIEDARLNAADITNATFHAGRVEKLLPELGVTPTAVVLDPARVGCEAPALEALAAMRPSRLVYVSCDPATLSRDLAILCDRGFTLQSVQPLDMFPQTYHVECVAVLR
jgi:precorrin-6B methylase 2